MTNMDNMDDRFDMIQEIKRVESFKKWPFSNRQNCNIQKLAEAGFFWTGTIKNPNSAQCFACNKELAGWESTDDPWEEHRKHATDCPYVVLGKSEEFLTFYQLHDLWLKMVKTYLNQIYLQKKEQFQTGSKKIRELALQHKQTDLPKRV